MWPEVRRVHGVLVCVADVRALPPGLLSDSFTRRLPPREVARISRLRREEDRTRSLVGLRLIEEAMFRSGRRWDWGSFVRDEAGRPGCEDAAVDVNVSHSGDIVVCAAGPGRVGIDVEKVAPIDMAEFRSAMPPAARRSVAAAPDPEFEFYRWWTRIESVIKADGRGVAADLASIVFDPQSAVLDGRRWLYYDLDFIPGYACALATATPTPAS